MATFADNLTDLMRARGLRQCELADRAGISRQVLSSLLLGDHRPRLDTAKAIAKALGCTIDALAGDENDERGQP